jgi:hypothetical protein
MSGEKKYYLANLPAKTDLRTLATTIKARWVCEQAHQQMKEELGLDHFEGRALMWGRSQFSVSSDRKAMDEAVNKFLAWVSKTEQDIEKAISESAYGTGYEDALKKEVYARLGIHPLSGAKVLPPNISL